MHSPGMWEPLAASDTWRMPVPGGWLVRVDTSSIRNHYDRGSVVGSDTVFRSTVTFLPDPDYTWDEFNRNMNTIMGVIS